MAISHNTEIEKGLWGAAAEQRVNSKVKALEYSVLALGLIFLRYADELSAAVAPGQRGGGGQ